MFNIGIKLNLTHHAIEQYQKRWARGLSIEEAEEELIKLCNSGAAATKYKTSNGDQIWRCGDIQMVIKRDGGGSWPVVVTVLPPYASIVEVGPEKDPWGEDPEYMKAYLKPMPEPNNDDDVSVLQPDDTLFSLKVLLVEAEAHSKRCTVASSSYSRKL